MKRPDQEIEYLKDCLIHELPIKVTHLSMSKVLKYIDHLEQSKVSILPSDEEIENQLLSLYGEGFLNRNASTLFIEWLKSQIKTMPKELINEDLSSIRFALKNAFDRKEISDIYKSIVNHYTKQSK